jgi:hypothetical protein
MSAIVKIYNAKSCLNHRAPALNMRQLLNPLFYSHDVRHPDRKRRRKARVKARALRQARKLKAVAVPCRMVLP